MRTQLSPERRASISRSDGPTGQRDADRADSYCGRTARGSSTGVIHGADLGLGRNHLNPFCGRCCGMVEIGRCEQAMGLAHFFRGISLGCCY